MCLLRRCLATAASYFIIPAFNRYITVYRKMKNVYKIFRKKGRELSGSFGVCENMEGIQLAHIRTQ
jgi:hypothetical protein